MSGYDIGGGYDAWKTATPWDDEILVSFSFECENCEEWNHDIEAVGSKRSDEVLVDCTECGAENSVDIGRDD